ncbi:hypothetical protein KsCSTR_38120 [Candidatus Kuenenia stuttgartiensis]|uniref:Uncharacterized protein n=1 Tax=Kuenenia stuttgartiensis TaxID=174633 RepID=Q1Q620_KUEST|nr:hypothetical protein KsCSTR_38120 [Candidatus Kuenenia stuttgartiensis]CAJ73012.1 unknown protein [Candidatus Kuenenia stuttgartiensis]
MSFVVRRTSSHYMHFLFLCPSSSKACIAATWARTGAGNYIRGSRLQTSLEPWNVLR